MAADPLRNEIVLFGGLGPGRTYLADTWILRAGRWERHDGIGPSARAWHAMTYDSARSVTVLFGGRGAGGALGDTWAWDGARWSPLPGPGPAARDHHAQAYDASTGSIVLFGGFDGRRVYGDTWRLTRHGWSEVPVAGPSPRAAHSMARASGRGGVSMFGGTEMPVRTLGDTWTLSDGKWAPALEPAPPLSHFGMDYFGPCACVMRFGGMNHERAPQNTTWALDTTGRWSVAQNAGPAPRIDFAFAALGPTLYLHGGKLPDPDGRQFDETWVFDGTVWRPVR